MVAQFVKDTIKNKCSKLWDVRYHWLTEHQAKEDLYIYWDRGKNNLAYNHTKYYSPKHDKNVRPKYILQNFLVQKLNISVENFHFITVLRRLEGVLKTRLK